MPLPPGLLEAIARGDASAVARRLDTAVPEGWTDTIPARSGSSNSRPIRASSRGSCGRSWCERRVGSWETWAFTERPTTTGRVEIGYGIVPLQRGRGYAREAIAGLTDWAFATGEAQVCVASVSPRNTASLALGGRSAFGRSASRSTSSTDSSSCSNGRCRWNPATDREKRRFRIRSAEGHLCLDARVVIRPRQIRCDLCTRSLGGRSWRALSCPPLRA